MNIKLLAMVAILGIPPPSHPLLTPSLTSHPASLTYAHSIHRPFWDHGGGNYPFNGGSGSRSGSGSHGPTNIPNRVPNNNGAPFDVEEANRARATHGVLAALAMVVLFPWGSILMRVVPGRWAMRVHAAMQVVALSLYLVAVAIGIWLVREVRIPGQSGGLVSFILFRRRREGADCLGQMSNPNLNSHPIIGLVVLGLLVLQPALGVVHHLRYKKTGTRQVWSYLHLFNGRAAITLGIANGGLGLWMAGEGKGLKAAYVVVAVVMWTLWMVAAVWGEWRRWKLIKSTDRH
jgi:hypothetical protein